MISPLRLLPIRQQMTTSNKRYRCMCIVIVRAISVFNLICTATNEPNELQFRLPDRGSLTSCIFTCKIQQTSFFQSYLPSNTITCCCSLRMALWRYPPKALWPLVCVWVCDVRLRFLERLSSTGCSTRSC